MNRKAPTVETLTYDGLSLACLNEIYDHICEVIDHDQNLYDCSHDSDELYDIQRDEKSLSFWNKKLDDVSAAIYAAQCQQEMDQCPTTHFNQPYRASDTVSWSYPSLDGYSPALTKEPLARPTMSSDIKAHKWFV